MSELAEAIVKLVDERAAVLTRAETLEEENRLLNILFGRRCDSLQALEAKWDALRGLVVRYRRVHNRPSILGPHKTLCGCGICSDADVALGEP